MRPLRGISGLTNLKACALTIGAIGVLCMAYDSMCYTRTKLLEIRPQCHEYLPAHLFHKLRSLGVAKAPRTHRGKRLNKSGVIPVRLTHRVNSTPTPIPYRRPCLTEIDFIDRRYLQKYHKLGQSIKLAHWNARSINGKTHNVVDSVMNDSLDVMCLTETWLSGSKKDSVILADLVNNLDGYDFVHQPRKTRGGGVGCLLRNTLNHKRNDTGKFKSFEHLDISVNNGPKLIRLVIIYRPPPNMKNKLSVKMFFTEFASLLETLITCPGQLLITGDFNFHIEDQQDSNARMFLDLLDSANLHQHVVTPTHDNSHTLDLIITNEADDLVSQISACNTLPSDHFLISCCLQMIPTKKLKKTVTFRKLQDIDLVEFTTKAQNLFSLDTSELPLSEQVKKYNNVLQQLVEEMAPTKSREITSRSKAPWYSDRVREAKRRRRRLERQYRKSRLTIHYQMFREQCHAYNKCLHDAKVEYHKSQIEDADSKSLFKVVKNLTQPKTTTVLPKHTSLQSMANDFANYFSEKIRLLRSSLDNTTDSNITVQIPEHNNCNMSTFQLVSPAEIYKIVSKSPSTSCALDPLPTWLLKKCTSSLLPQITNIINCSLATGSVPDDFKVALVTPLLKKSSLDAEVFKNYRPISNLPFLSKVLERAVASQLEQYLSQNGLHSQMQSAYKKHHSTETAVLKVYNDLLCGLDTHKECILILLDMSAAFDTIDHIVLLARLRNRFGIKDTVLSWLTSYLKYRSQQVIIGSVRSSPVHLEYGVPQGSVLGPVLFTMYVAPLEDIIRAHGLSTVVYADDTQLFITTTHEDRPATISQLQKCVQDIKNWTKLNKLMFNDSKTEVLHVTSKFRNASVLSGVNIGDSFIAPTSCVRDLGIMLDEHLDMSAHVNAIVKSASFEIFKLGKIRKNLDKKTTERLVHAFITSRLDNGNSMLYGLPEKLLDNLQLIQNTAARLITRAKKHEHITPILEDLHWLPVRSRIIYKILLITYKAQHDAAPSYITNLVSHYTSTRSLRSDAQNYLHEPRYLQESYGARAFCNASPRLWNKLPASLRSSPSLSHFKSGLKTHLFKINLSHR